jgi:toxin ParE1/3/4
VAIKLIYTKISLNDLRDIFDFIKKDSPYYAKKEVDDIRTAIKKLKVNSLLGKRFERSEDDTLRELIFKNYRIIYQIISPEQIDILSIHHHARSITNNPAFKDDD